MNNLKFLIVAVTCLILTVSCEKETILLVTEDSRNCSFPEQGGNKQIVFTCNNSWDVSVSDSWIHVSPSSGSSSNKEIILTISCDPNSTYDSRTASLILSSRDLSEIISISQNAKNELLVSPEKFYLSNEAQTVEIEINSNVEYTITIDDNCKDWIAQSETKGLSTNVTFFKITANLTYDSREGKIYFVQKDGTANEVTIIQQQLDAFFHYAPDNNMLSFKEQTFEIKTLTNIAVDVIIDSEWITYEETRGLNESSIILKIKENKTFEKRFGKVVLKHNLLEYIIELTQYGQPINLSYKGTANCYIVPPTDGYYCIDASVSGNDKSYLIKGGTKASIIWEAAGDHSQEKLIDSIEYEIESGRIIFRTTQLEGNALIALKDENDTIIWSWHLWLTLYDPDVSYTTFSDGAVLMNRYLGANSEETPGAYYQWGRKDPFLYGKYKYVSINEDTGTVAFSISHPDTYLSYRYELSEWDWNYEHSSTWSSSKSVYDPCPPGWKVMDSSCFSSLPDDFTLEVNNSCIIIGEPLCTPSSKFGYTSLLHSTGSIDWGARIVSIWTNRGSYHSFYDALGIDITDYGIQNWVSSGRAYGECVRCQRE